MQDVGKILSDLARAKALFQGRAIAAAMGDMAATGQGVVRLTVDGVEHITPSAVRRNMCYGCGRVEAPEGYTGAFYCGGCAEWDAYTSDPGEDAPEDE